MNKVVSCTYCVNTVLFISSFPVSCEGLPGFSLIWLRMLRQTCSRCRRREKRLHGLEIPESGRIFANVSANVARSYEFGCECRRGDKSLRMSANARSVANVATNVGKRCQPYECRKFCKYLRQKKRLRMSGGGFVCLCASGHEKSGKFSRFFVLSFEVMISYSGSA